MIETYWLVAEGAAVAVPAAATAAYALNGRKRLRTLVREPLFWDGGAPVSLATIFSELNGESDMTGSLRELVGGSGPLGTAELERAVRLLQANAGLCRDFVLDQATEAVLRCAMPSGHGSAPASAMQLMARLSDAFDAQGFFRFVAGLNAERAGQASSKDQPPALLPVEGVQAGGLPVSAEAEAPMGPPLTDGGVLGVLTAMGLGQGRDWLPAVARAVEDLVRERQVKKARDAYFRALRTLGAAAADELKRRSPAGAQIRRNVYSPLDAYRNLQARVGACKPARSGLKQLLVPSVEAVLWMAYASSLERALAIVADKCQALERLLLGKQGLPVAGEVLFRHREGLLAGVAPDAFPVAAAESAYQAYLHLKQPTNTDAP